MVTAEFGWREKIPQTPEVRKSLLRGAAVLRVTLRSNHNKWEVVHLWPKTDKSINAIRYFLPLMRAYGGESVHTRWSIKTSNDGGVLLEAHILIISCALKFERENCHCFAVKCSFLHVDKMHWLVKTVHFETNQRVKCFYSPLRVAIHTVWLRLLIICPQCKCASGWTNTLSSLRNACCISVIACVFWLVRLFPYLCKSVISK